MKINKLKINGFGKLKNKEIYFSNGINIIKGKNESGKSTILSFIISCFFGLSKNRSLNSALDLEKFKPWSGEEFSGKIEYTLDNGRLYEIYRDFYKKNPVIYNELKEDITSNYQIDKNKGINCLQEQTGLTEELFLNTSIIRQEFVRFDKNAQYSLIQKISNYIDSGNDSISFKKTLEKINKRQNDEVGTNRTQQKPINIINDKIEKLQNQKMQFEKTKENLGAFFEKLEENKYELELEKKKIEFLNEIRDEFENDIIDFTKINYEKKECNNCEKKISEIQELLLSKNKKNNIFYFWIIYLLEIIISGIIFNKYGIKALAIIIPVLLISAMIHIFVRKNKKNENVDKNKLKNELEILRNNQIEKQKNLKLLESNLDEKLEKRNKALENKYKDDIDLEYLSCYLHSTNENIKREIENVNKNINKICIDRKTSEFEYEKQNQKLEFSSQIEEKLNDAKEEKLELEKLNSSFNIAKECLENAYEKVKENISPNFTRNLNEIVFNISGGKYNNININDNGIIVENELGEYVDSNKLSTGTIDQMYLSLRLGALNEITSENIPFFLDETFAYFDDERLQNIIYYLSSKCNNKQIIIYTCSNREIECLNKMNIEYNLINLEK